MGLTAPNSLSTDILRTSFGRETHPMKFVSSVIRRRISPVQGAVPRPCAVRGTCACSVDIGGTEHRSRRQAEHDACSNTGAQSAMDFQKREETSQSPLGRAFGGNGNRAETSSSTCKRESQKGAVPPPSSRHQKKPTSSHAFRCNVHWLETSSGVPR